MGLRDSLELDEMIRQFIAEEDVKAPTDLRPYDYEELLDVTFKLVNAADYFEYDDTYNVWKDKSGDEEYMRELVSQGEDITIVGVVQPREDAIATILDAGIGYPAADTACDRGGCSKLHCSRAACRAEYKRADRRCLWGG